MLYRMQNHHGGDVYQNPVLLDFSVNINPYGTPESVKAAIRDAAERAAEYPDPYCRELVRAIAQAEQVPEEWVLCGNGAAELIYSYCQAEGSRYAVETAPAFSEYSAGLELVGGEMLRYPLKQEQGFALDEEFFAFLEKTFCSCSAQSSVPVFARVSSNSGTVFLCNPNNPDGRNIPMDLLTKILAWCAKHQVRLFLDECFLEMSDHPDSLKSFLPDHPELFLLKAFTKNYGMAGIRLGYGLCSDEALLSEMSRKVQPWNVSIPAQAAGIAALREQGWILQARELIRAERKRMTDELNRLGFYVNPSEANYLLIHGKPGIEKALREYGIAIRNCEDYENLEAGWYRIGLKLPEENDRLIRRLKKICFSDVPDDRSNRNETYCISEQFD